MSEGLKLLTIEQAADRLAIRRTSLYRLLDSGELESVHIGRARRIPEDAVDRFIESLRTKQESCAS